MENIGENQGTARKITAFFLDVSVLPSTLDALKRLGKTGGLKRLARCGEQRENSGIIRKTRIRETREIGKKEEIEKTARRTNGLQKREREPLDAEIERKRRRRAL
jgi:hypothetical protein